MIVKTRWEQAKSHKIAASCLLHWGRRHWLRKEQPIWSEAKGTFTTAAAQSIAVNWKSRQSSYLWCGKAKPKLLTSTFIAPLDCLMRPGILECHMENEYHQPHPRLWRKHHCFTAHCCDGICCVAFPSLQKIWTWVHTKESTAPELVCSPGSSSVFYLHVYHLHTGSKNKQLL